jgi:hypothetical protein
MWRAVASCSRCGGCADRDGLGELLAKGAVTVYWARESLESLLPDLRSKGYWGPLSVVPVHAAAVVLLALGGLWWRGRSA